MHKAPVLPAVNVNMLIIGKPFAGKKTLAQNIAQVYKLHVLVFDELVSEAVK
jgi:adenylate kinase family enzyme